MIVPGLVAVIMMIIAAMLTSLTIAREWERGTMEQLAATPVTRAEAALGKLLPYLASALIDVAHYARSSGSRGVPGAVPRQDAVLFGVLDTFFLDRRARAGHVHLGRRKSQLVATQMAMVGDLPPAFLLSGFMFAISVMPSHSRS